MQEIYGLMRKAITEYDLITDGDKIAVGISGGKDSLVTLAGLSGLRRFIGIDYELTAITVDLGFGGEVGDYSEVEKFCNSLGVPYIVKKTDIASVVFDIRNEKFPCSLCARMRHGSLHDVAKEYGCNKVALGHHMDDAVETFLMNLYTEGRLGCFSPKSYLSRKDLTMIRPLVFATESQTINCANRNNLPVFKSKCPVDRTTNREKTKNEIKEIEKIHPDFKAKVFGAIRRKNLDGWGGMTYGEGQIINKD